ncbi:Maf family nucleotide pyrophosphatase [Roseivirga sp. E12]|uniref:Maf family nucleotide pyrophosphatase n=1 Tax=Roseivirga sp. E12 TaxID=2819237 RepID=UPI001ABCC853|nr:Maf family nucleotide pyrophosphatase [Roseivirga sp. E12]MBO3698421.1 septum formation protein Maf [Roseivirga sp. E12]
MNLNYHLILASKSPRRQELLKSLGLEFEISVKEVDESFPPDLTCLEVAEYLARKKSHAFGTLKSKVLVITSDTTVIVDSEILGKAKNKTEATSMIKALSGRTHQVATGVCLRTQNKEVSFTEITSVTFDSLSDEMISYYIERYKPFDKAGAYGIQEWIGMIGINKIEGDYYNVMGLPLNRLYKELRQFK